MKKIILFATAAVLALSLASCKKFLDVQPEGAPTSGTFFNSDDHAVNAIKALYAEIVQEGCYGREIFWEQCATKMYVGGKNRGYGSTLFTMLYDGSESPLKSSYSRLMQTQARANFVIQSLLKKESLTEIETRSLGEAYFMRGYCHFMIAYRYGCKTQGVPAVKYEQCNGEYDYSIPPQQPTVMDNYAMIIEDFAEAEKLLPKYETYSADDRGRAHKVAACAMMARVYAYWAAYDSKRWDDVILCVDKLEKEYGRALISNYADLFAPDFSKYWGTEYCWTIPGNGGADASQGGSEFPGVCLENKGWGKYNGWGQFKPTYDMYEMLKEDGDNNIRLRTNIIEYGQEFQFFGETRKFWSTSDLESGFMIGKYIQAFADADCIAKGYVNSNGDWPTTRVNFTLIRFADCLLLRAEAKLAKGDASGAAADIKKVRVRSGLAPISTATWKDIYHERCCELAYEPGADHLGDLRRWMIGGDAEIKALAKKELTEYPRVRKYADRSDYASTCEVVRYTNEEVAGGRVWADHKVCFPYAADEITKSAGQYKQNPGY